MSSHDTQWPLYEVFVQEKAERPFQSVGAVHAADAEMAILNARTVFVRRPACHALWVARRSAILMRTAEELADDAKNEFDTGEPQRYQIFQKTSQRRAMIYVGHVGEVTAVSPHHALQQAIHTFGSDEEVFVWWVVPNSAITSTDNDDIDSLFDPALDKTYRHPSAYRTFTAIRKARQGGNQ